MNVRNYKDSSKRASKKHVSFHALLFISIMIAAFLSMYPIRHQARDPSGLPTSEDDSQPHRSLNGVQPAIFHLTADPIKVPFVLHRARQVISIEQKIQKDPHVGACHKGQSLLAPIPSYVCEELHCLWSEAAQQNIDLYINPLSPLSQPTLGSNDDWASQKTCPKPRGGQRATLFGQPKVSFIVTMYNNVETTAKCILELFRTAHEVDSAEIIIINDGSTEDAYKVTRIIDLLRYYFGTVIKYHSNSEPSGYGAANSKGIEMASGKYIALINNDMFVTKGWLGSLLWTLETRPQTGIVGPLFLQDKGIVAEAGGLIWNDASGANVSRGKRLAHQFNHARVVDYISAACIIFAKETFLALGGFDARYEKGYYEDTDLAFTMTQAGLDIVYQPLAVVYHQEGSTFGTDQTSDLKRQLMKQNKAKFVEKWADKLQYHCPQEVGLMEGSHRASYPRLLWVDDIIPEPDRDSGSIRNINLMKILLSFGYAVSFKPNVVRSPAYEAFVRGIGVHVLPASSPASWKLTNGGVCAFDVVWVARRSIFNATVEAIKSQCPTTPLIYDTVDIHFLREARDALTNSATSTGWDFQGVTTNHIIDWFDANPTDPQVEAVRLNRDLELSFIDASQVTVVVSPDEVDIIKHYRPNAQIAVVSNIHDLSSDGVDEDNDNSSNDDPGYCSSRTGILFVGNMNPPPNRQAVQHLIEEILPLLIEKLTREELQDFRVHVVGANVLGPELQKVLNAHTDTVVFHGYLSDDELLMLYNHVRSVVAPLLSGAGVKGKVNQAMKYGTPVVATPLAVEGMHATDGVDCMVGRSPEEFVDKLVKVYRDCDLWRRLVVGGRDNMRQHFSYEGAVPVVKELFTSVGAAPVDWRTTKCTSKHQQ